MTFNKKTVVENDVDIQERKKGRYKIKLIRTTKKEYVEAHGRSMLATELIEYDCSDDQEIIVGSGLLSPAARNSNLYKALKQANSTVYLVGGRRYQQRSGGYWFAAIVK